MTQETHYSILNLVPNCDPSLITSARKALAKKYHPDRYEGDKQFATEMMQKINKAYEVLSDPVKRAAYDEQLKRSRQSSAGGNRSSQNSTRGQQSRSEKQSRQQSSNGRKEQSGQESSNKKKTAIEDWNYAVAYFPHLDGLFGTLHTIDHDLGELFKASILRDKLFDEAQARKKAAQLKEELATHHFGKNARAKQVGLAYLAAGNKAAALELNRALNFFGGKTAEQTVAQITAKFGDPISQSSQSFGSYEESSENFYNLAIIASVSCLILLIIIFG